MSVWSGCRWRWWEAGAGLCLSRVAGDHQQGMQTHSENLRAALPIASTSYTCTSHCHHRHHRHCHYRLQVHTVGVGVAIGQSCLLLSAGEKGKRFMLEHATAMLHQPRVPPTGQRQAIEVQIKWREVRVVGWAGGRAGVRGGEL